MKSELTHDAGDSRRILRSLCAGACALGFLVSADSAEAQTIVHNWSFDSATNPETSDQGGSIDKWTIAAPNTVPSAGQLGWATGGNSNTLALGLDVTQPENSQFTVTMDIVDLFVGRDPEVSADQMRLRFITDDGNLEVGFDTDSGAGSGFLNLDVKGGDTNGTNTYADLLSEVDQTATSPLLVTVTFDFAANEISVEVTGSATLSDTYAADLSNITTINSVRSVGSVGNGSSMTLESVQLTVPGEDPPPPATPLHIWTFDSATNPETSDQGGSIDKWTIAAPNTVPAAGQLGWATGGSSDTLALGLDVTQPENSEFIVTMDIVDLFIGRDAGVSSDNMRLRIGTDDGNLEVGFDVYSGSTSGFLNLDVKGGDTNGTNTYADLLSEVDQTATSPLLVTVTFDFAANEISVEVTGSATLSDTYAADLSNITTINSVRSTAEVGNGSSMTLETVELAVRGQVDPIEVTAIAVSGGTVTIDFTAGSSDTTGDFVLQSSATLQGFSDDVTAGPVTGGSGVFQVTVPASGSEHFYRIRR